MAAKWSAQSTKATPVAADTSLLIDSVTGASKQFSLGSLSQLTALSVSTTLGVTGATTLSSTLSAGASTLASLGVAGAATVGSAFGVTGLTTLATSAHTGAATFATTVGVTGAATFSSTLGVTGLTTLGSVSTSVASITGLSGATSGTRYVGATSSGAPVTGAFVIGDYVIARNGAVWICTTAGTPGTWVNAGTGSDLWSVDSSIYLRPQAGQGYIGAKFYNTGQTQSTEISYQSNGIYYNSSDAAALHRFWQTLQAEKDLILNTTGALTSSKGIQLATSVPDARFGYDSGNIRTNLADNTKSHIWSAGTIGSAATTASLTGTGKFTVVKTVSGGIGNWAAGLFGTDSVALDPFVALGYYNSKATVAALNNAQSGFEHLALVGTGKTLSVQFDTAFMPSIDLTGTLYVSGATTLAATLGVTGLTTLATSAHTGAATFATTVGVTGLTTLATSAHTGAATFSSTLGVTGTSTLAAVNSNVITAVHTAAWYGIVAGGNGGTNRTVIGNISAVSAIGGHNSALNAWTSLYIQPGVTSPGVGICLTPSTGQTANASLHSGGSTIVGCPPSAVSDASHYASQMSWSVNEGGNTLTFKVKYSDGSTVKSVSFSLF